MCVIALQVQSLRCASGISLEVSGCRTELKDFFLKKSQTWPCYAVGFANIDLSCDLVQITIAFRSPLAPQAAQALQRDDVTLLSLHDRLSDRVVVHLTEL